MKKFFILSLISLSFITVQSDFDVKKVVDRLTSYSLKFPQEKVYVHFDKPVYSTGETIWFKGYLVDAFTNQPITLSKVVYLELLGTDNELIEEKALRVNRGGVEGDFFLPDSLDVGTYHVRAYTNWMRNFDSDYFFRHSFQVLKTQTDNPTVEVENSIQLTFFPEGGDLVDSLTSIVGLKATDRYGKGLSVEGKVVNSRNETVTSFESDERGIGAMILIPDPTQELTAVVEYQGKNHTFSIPAVKKQGYSLRATNTFSSDVITIGISSSGLPLKGSGIIAHKSGEVFYSAVNQSEESTFAVRLYKKDFPSGICHITFFDPSGKPQAERLVYVNYPATNAEIQLKSDKEMYETRSLAGLTLQVYDSAQKAVPSNLSISITPQNLVQYPAYYRNITNYLNLTSDLVGVVEDPAFYLEKSKEAYRSVDLLLLTQGWRRFKWEDVLNYQDDQVPSFWAEDGIIFSGQIVDYFKRDVPRESAISFSVLDNDLGFITGETDEEGRFFFSGNDFYDSTDMLLQAKRKLKKEGKFRDDVFIKLDKQVAPAINSEVFQPIPFSLLDNKEQYLAQKEKMEKADRAFNFDADATMLDAVSVTGIRQIVNDPFESPFKIYGDPTNRIIADSVMRGGPLINVYDLFARIPGVRILGSFPNQGVRIGGPKNLSGGNDPLYLLDGINISSEALSSISPSIISHVDVLKGPDAVIYGAQGANGVIAIYTKTGMGYEGIKTPPNMGVLNVSHPGYSKVREFFTPNYDIPKDEHAKPDIRTTLFWKPTILTGDAENESFSFYTSDQPGVFDVIIEGITVDGEPLFLKETFKVK